MNSERLLPRRRLLPLRPEDDDIEPEDPLSNVRTQTPTLYLYALFSITYHLFYKCHLIHVALHLVGCG